MQLQSGTEHGITLGTPIGLLVRNEDQRPKDYSETDLYPRPSHADWTYLEKYGVKASSGGGRSSARETIGKLCRLLTRMVMVLTARYRQSSGWGYCGEVLEACVWGRDRGVRVLRWEGPIAFVRLFPVAGFRRG